MPDMRGVVPDLQSSYQAAVKKECGGKPVTAVTVNIYYRGKDGGKAYLKN